MWLWSTAHHVTPQTRPDCPVTMPRPRGPLRTGPRRTPGSGLRGLRGQTTTQVNKWLDVTPFGKSHVKISELRLYHYSHCFVLSMLSTILGFSCQQTHHEVLVLCMYYNREFGLDAKMKRAGTNNYAGNGKWHQESLRRSLFDLNCGD